MASTIFSKEKREQLKKGIEKQIRYLENTEIQLKVENYHDTASDYKLPSETHSLIARKRREEPFESEDLQLVPSGNNNDYIRVVINGKTGKGKSALGNNLLGFTQFRSKTSLAGITKKCTYGARYLGKYYKLLVVDTPGLFDTGTPNKEMSKEITKCVALAAPGPHIFIFVVSTERFTPEEQETLINLQELFGEKVIDHVIIVFTRKEHLEDVGIMEFLKYADDILLDLLVKCKFRFAFINNRADPDDLSVDIGVILDLIFKTIGENGGAYYTNTDFGIVDDVVENMMDKNLENKEKEIQQLKEEKSKLLDALKEAEGRMITACIENEVREINGRIKETQNRNPYSEAKQEIENCDKNGTFGQMLKKALGIGAGITAGAAAGAAFVAGAPIVAAGAGVAAAASWLSSWL